MLLLSNIRSSYLETKVSWSNLALFGYSSTRIVIQWVLSNDAGACLYTSDQFIFPTLVAEIDPEATVIIFYNILRLFKEISVSTTLFYLRYSL